MKTELEQIRRLIHGAVRFNEKNGELSLSRFTEEQYRVYENHNTFSVRAHADAGIRLEFETDAASFRFSGRIEPGSSRNFYWFDVVVNGFLCAHTGTEKRDEQPEFSYEIPLGSGVKQVTVYFPGLSKVFLRELKFSGAGFVKPVVRPRKILCFGDSITQGYDARFSSLAYANQLADAWSAEIFNKAIGGEVFNPALAAAEDPVKPDLITVAYGTNDWSKCSREDFLHNSSEFFRILSGKYPAVPTFALLPLWRSDCETRQTSVGSFPYVYDSIRKFCAPYPQITVVEGWQLVPHQAACFSADGLHPNDFGFQFMARNLLRAIKLK